MSRNPDLLITKLQIPQPPEFLTPRHRLVESLNHGVREKLALVTAPAGFGKTTLLAEWASQASLPVAWISLDERDNDPLVFFSTLTASFATLGMSVGERARETIKVQKPPAIRRLLMALVHELADQAAEMALVLDDFHRLSNPEIVEALCEFFTDLPDHVHLVVASRTIPDIPCAKYHSRRQLTRFDEGDLKFTQAELGAFFRDGFALSLSPQEIRKLESLTEGWVIALQMAGLALQESSHAHDLLGAFPEAQQDIQRYLLEEVLDAQPEPVREFLLRASPLARFCVPLCDHIAGHTGSAQIIQQLKARKLLIFPLDASGEWYRFHHLFRDLLQSHQTGSDPDSLPFIHQRAAEWFRAQGYWADAIHHDLQAGDFAQATADIEHIMEQYWQVGETATILGWIRALPDEFIQSNPNMELFLAWMLYMDGQIEIADQKFARIHQDLDDKHHSLPAEKKSLLAGKLSSMRAAYFCAVNHPEDALACSKIAQSLLPSHTVTWLGVSYNAQGVALRSLGQYDLSVQAFTQACKEHERSGNVYGLFVALSALAELYLDQGHMGSAMEVCQQASAMIERNDLRFIPTGIIYLSMGKVLLEWAEFTRAEETLEKCIEVLIEDQDLDCLLEAYYHLARLVLHTTNAPAAVRVMAMAGKLPGAHNLPLLLEMRLRAYQTRLLLARGQVDQAALLLRAIDPRRLERAQFAGAVRQVQTGRVTAYVVARNPGAYTLAFEEITQAYVLLRQDSAAEATLLLENLIRLGNARPSSPKVLDAHLLLALAYNALGDRKKSLGTLRTALQHTMQEGHVFCFLQFGDEMRELIEMVLQQEKSGQHGRAGAHIPTGLVLHLNKLLAAFRLLQPQDNECSERKLATALIEPLTSREAQVLVLLTEGLSYSAIAQALTVTENTVRTHIKNIYGKLNVNNRVQAVTRAIELDLVSPGEHR